MTNLNNQSQTAKQGFDIPAIAKEVERVYGIYNQNIVRTVLEQAAAPELLEELQRLLRFEEVRLNIDTTRAQQVITKATGGTK